MVIAVVIVVVIVVVLLGFCLFCFCFVAGQEIVVALCCLLCCEVLHLTRGARLEI